MRKQLEMANMDQIAAITTGPGSFVEAGVAAPAPAVVLPDVVSSLPAMAPRMSAMLEYRKRL